MPIFFSRRAMLQGAAALSAGVAAGPLRAEPGLAELRIGYQKTSALLVAKALGLIEKRFAAEGAKVSWVDFQAGPPLLEALNAGAIDYGYTGDAPPIFAQAGRAKILYVAAIPARGNNQSILVPKDSPVKNLGDLRGKKIGYAKGSSAHNVVVAALAAAGVKLDDVTSVYLAPADAGAAFSSGAIDAWAVWDPYYAIAELSKNARALPLDWSAVTQNSFFLSNPAFAAKNPNALRAIGEEVAAATKWAAENRDAVAKLFAQASGVDLAAQQRAVARAEFSYGPLTDRILDQQQAVADRFYGLKLIPNPIVVRDIVWEGARV